MANFFDQFDTSAAPAQPAQGGNFFDQFDASARGVMDQLTGATGPRYQLWPERMAREIAGLPQSSYDAAQQATAGMLQGPQATGGTEIPESALTAPMAQKGLEVAGLVAPATKFAPQLKAAPAAAPKAIPTKQDLFAEAKGGYEAARDLGVEIKSEAGTSLANKIKTDLNGIGIDENLAPKTFGVLSKAETAPQGAIMTVENLQSLRRTLGNAAGSIDKTERMAATQAKNALDEWLANIPESAVIKGDPKAASKLLKEANANYAAASRADAIDKRVVRAEMRAAAANSGMNVANTIRARMADIMGNPALQRGYTKEELAQMEKIVRGTAVGNTARFVKNIFGGGGGLGTLATASVGSLAAGGPHGAMLAAPGVMGRMIADASTMRQVRALDHLLRSNSPLAQKSAAALPPSNARSLPPPALMAALLSGQRTTFPLFPAQVPAYADDNQQRRGR